MLATSGITSTELTDNPTAAIHAVEFAPEKVGDPCVPDSTDTCPFATLDEVSQLTSECRCCLLWAVPK